MTPNSSRAGGIAGWWKTRLACTKPWVPPSAPGKTSPQDSNPFTTHSVTGQRPVVLPIYGMERLPARRRWSLSVSTWECAHTWQHTVVVRRLGPQGRGGWHLRSHAGQEGMASAEKGEHCGRIQRTVERGLLWRAGLLSAVRQGSGQPCSWRTGTLKPHQYTLQGQTLPPWTAHLIL